MSGVGVYGGLPAGFSTLEPSEKSCVLSSLPQCPPLGFDLGGGEKSEERAWLGVLTAGHGRCMICSPHELQQELGEQEGL